MESVLQIQQSVYAALPAYRDLPLSIELLAGLSNVTYKVSADGKLPLLFKKFGCLINLDSEKKIIQRLNQYGVGAKQLFHGGSYRIEEFIQGGYHPTVLQMERLQEQALVFNALSRFHKISIEKEPDFVPICQQIFAASYIKDLLSIQTTSSKDQAYQTELVALLEFIRSEKKYLAQNDPAHQCCCHNDLCLVNMLRVNDGYVLIDFDYSGYNQVSYDLANFLNESSIDYTVREFPFLRIHRRLTLDDIAKACRIYPDYYVGMEQDTLRMLVICNLFWAGWSLLLKNELELKGWGWVQHGYLRIDLTKYYLGLIEGQVSHK